MSLYSNEIGNFFPVKPPDLYASNPLLLLLLVIVEVVCVLSLCKYTCTCEFASWSCIIIIRWSVCAEHFVPFSYKINSRRFSILQGACCSSQGRFSKNWLNKLSHKEPLENCNSRCCIYSIICPLFMPVSVSATVCALFSLFPSTNFSDHFVSDIQRLQQQIWICNVHCSSLSHNRKSYECSDRHFHKCQCFSAIVEDLQRHKMSPSQLSHSLCELLTSGNVNEQTIVGANSSWMTESTATSNLLRRVLATRYKGYVHMTSLKSLAYLSTASISLKKNILYWENLQLRKQQN